MIQSEFFGVVAVSLEKCLSIKYPGNDWHCKKVESSRPYLVYVHNDPCLYFGIRQEYFMDNSEVQVVCHHADAQVWFTGREKEGCKVYNMYKSNESLVFNERCETFDNLRDAIMRFLNLTSLDTATPITATLKRKAK